MRVPIMPGACLSLWPTEECEWSTWDIWRSSDVVVHAIYLGLGLMLGYTCFVLARFLLRYYHDFKPEPSTDLRNPRRLISDLSQGLGALKAISSTAPFLGLAGTSYGILAALWFSYSGTPNRYVALVFTRIAFASATTLAGILVAIPAIVSHNLLRVRIQREGARFLANKKEYFGSFRHAQTLPLKARSSGLPHFALLSAPALASVIALLTPFHPYRIPTGLAISLPNTYCQHDPVDRLVVLSITNNDKLFINTESLSWNDLRSRLSAIYATRAEKVLYLRAEDGVSFQKIADAIDIARNSPASDSVHITVILITPSTAQGCVPKNVWL